MILLIIQVLSPQIGRDQLMKGQVMRSGLQVIE